MARAPSGLSRPPCMNSGSSGRRLRICAGGRQAGHLTLRLTLLGAGPFETALGRGDPVHGRLAATESVIEREVSSIDDHRAWRFVAAIGDDTAALDLRRLRRCGGHRLAARRDEDHSLAPGRQLGKRRSGDGEEGGKRGGENASGHGCRSRESRVERGWMGKAGPNPGRQPGVMPRDRRGVRCAEPNRYTGEIAVA